MEKIDELKPVPCGCGGEAHTTEYPYSDGKGYGVTCVKCLCNVPTIHKTEAEAVTAWNKAMGRKTGEWIKVESETVNGRCSVCGYESHLYENDVYGEHFCPNCGADMRSQNT